VKERRRESILKTLLYDIFMKREGSMPHSILRITEMLKSVEGEGERKPLFSRLAFCGVKTLSL